MTNLIEQAFSDAPLSRPPVWLMRQAGRYMSEYRALKEKHSFLELCRTPELACEVTLQPIKAFRPDAAIIFADILLPATALGFEIDFNPGPIVKNKLTQFTELPGRSLVSIEEQFKFLTEAVSLVKAELKKIDLAANDGHETALLGFAGSPWTLACYLIDQSPYKHFQKTTIQAVTESQNFASFLETIADLTADYLIAQIEAGADAVQIFDSWGGILSAEDYTRFSLPFIEQIIDKVSEKTSNIMLYVGDGSHLLKQLAQSSAAGISLDWRSEIAPAEETLGDSKIIQGNLDPTHLFGSVQEVKARTYEMLSKVNRRNRYIANLGHGILQHTPPANVEAFIQTVKAGWPK